MKATHAETERKMALIEMPKTNFAAGRTYWTTASGDGGFKKLCTTGKERRITRSQDEHVLEAAKERLDVNPPAMRQRRETADHPFGTMLARMGAPRLPMRTLTKVATEMACTCSPTVSRAC